MDTSSTLLLIACGDPAIAESSEQRSNKGKLNECDSSVLCGNDA